MSLIIFLLGFVGLRYLPVFKAKVNSEYQKRFGITIFSKENLKKPFIASMLILYGKLNSKSHSLFSLSIENLLIMVGICIIIYVIYDTYKKTDFVYGTAAAIIYIIVVSLQVMFGVMLIVLFMLWIAMLAMSKPKDDS